MKMFLWQYVSNLTENYHSGGGLVVIADDLDHAREYIKTQVPKDCFAFTDPPTHTATVNEVEPKFWVFQDAGCC